LRRPIKHLETGIETEDCPGMVSRRRLRGWDCMAIMPIADLGSGPIRLRPGGKSEAHVRHGFTAISNTATQCTQWDVLADGSIVTVGHNTFHANYEGGDGNDLTLIVVQ